MYILHKALATHVNVLYIYIYIYMCECVYVQQFTYFKISPYHIHTQCNFTRTCMLRDAMELTHGTTVYDFQQCPLNNNGYIAIYLIESLGSSYITGHNLGWISWT